MSSSKTIGSASSHQVVRYSGQFPHRYQRFGQPAHLLAEPKSYILILMHSVSKAQSEGLLLVAFHATFVIMG